MLNKRCLNFMPRVGWNLEARSGGTLAKHRQLANSLPTACLHVSLLFLFFFVSVIINNNLTSANQDVPIVQVHLLTTISYVGQSEVREGRSLGWG